MVKINLIPTIYDVTRRTFAVVMIRWREMAGDTFTGRASIFTLDMTIGTRQIGVTADKRVEAMVEIVTHEEHTFGGNGRWPFILRLDDGDQLSWAGGGSY